MARRSSPNGLVRRSTAWASLAQRRTVLILAIALLALVGILIFGMTREVTSTSPPTTARPSRPPTRPAFTAAEERYIREMWPIHGDVERSLMRASLGQIFYKTQDLKRSDLKARLEQSLAVYRRAEGRLQALEPPPSLRRDHDEYASAVRLFKESAIEVLKMFEDGRDDHMLAAYPKSQAGSDKIREVGGKFWPNEFPPN